MRTLMGISGTLVPGGYLAAQFAADAHELGAVPAPQGLQKAVAAIWRRAQANCGPATGVRALYDLVAEPLFEVLGFKSRDLSIGRREATAVLVTPAGRTVALLLLPWASAPSSAWRDVYQHGLATGSAWAFILAPPYLSLVQTAGIAVRKRLDFSLPAVLAQGADGPFWTLTSAQAFEPTPDSAGTRPPAPLIAAILARAATFQDRVRRDLRVGVAEALSALNEALAVTTRVTRPRGSADAEHRDKALALVYRILFLLFAESRDLVPLGHPIYGRSYSVGTLAREALHGSTAGCWDGFGAMTRLARSGCRSTSLIVAPFGGRLFARASVASLEEPSPPRRAPFQRSRRDTAFGRALVALASRQARAGREVISYRDLGVEELGAVYERLLDLPVAAERSTPASPASCPSSRIRKLTGTFYTPQPLAELIVRRTLSPLVRGASADTILSLRILDPAMGSGACLIAACRYLAAAYERALIDEGRAAAEDFNERGRADLRRLISERCLAGVDRNPTAVELARLSLWLATLAHGKPLGFLDHRLRAGDSLIGAWPHDLSRLSLAPSSNAKPLPLFEHLTIGTTLGKIGPSIANLLHARDDTIDAVRWKTAVWRGISSPSSPLEPWRQALSFWCARWFWPGGKADRPSAAESRAVIDALVARDTTLPRERLARRLQTATAVARARGIFHWPLEYPDVFYLPSGDSRPVPGFDAIIGNPPWEMLRRDDGRESTDAHDLLSYVRESGHYPSCRQGHLNLYQAFLDRALSLVRPNGRIGMVVPWGLASDDGAAPLRRRLFETSDINTLVGLDNSEGLFPIHRGIRFLVFTATAGQPTTEIAARFGVKTSDELEELPDVDDPMAPAYPVKLTMRKIATVGGPMLRIPDVRHSDDLEFAADLARRIPPIGDPAGWNLSFGREANATEARPWIGRHGLPVLEGKHLSPFVFEPDHGRRIERAAAERLAHGMSFDRSRLAYRDVSGVGNALTLIAAVVPPGVLTTHTLFCLKTPLSLERQHFLAAFFNSWVLNSVVRLLMGGHVTTSLVEGLSVPAWRGDPADRWIARAALRLASGAEDHRLLARLQSAVASRYELSAGAFRRIVDSFPLVPAALREAAWSHFTEHHASANVR